MKSLHSSVINDKSTLAWPEGKRFAFTIVDDTDAATVENVGAIYDFLYELGVRTTKTVWPLASPGNPVQRGQSLEDSGYRDFILGLKEKGFEIALHGVSSESAARERVNYGLEKFKEIIGCAPRLHANHVGQADGMYWGEDRFDGLVKKCYQLARRHVMKAESKYYGHEEASQYFWGDLCQKEIKFVRNMVFNDVNTLKVDTLMPYHDPRRPYVRFWFSSSAAGDVDLFCNLLNASNQEKLVEEGGACIVYTHLGFGFFKDGQINKRFVEIMCKLASLQGWFVPASVLLEHIGEQRGWKNVEQNKRTFSRMQWKWLVERIGRGTK